MIINFRGYLIKNKKFYNDKKILYADKLKIKNNEIKIYSKKSFKEEYFITFIKHI